MTLSPGRRNLGDRAPLSSDEMRQGTAVLAPPSETRPRVNWRVFIISAVVIIAFSMWAIFAPANAESTLQQVVGWIGENLGWWYVLTITVVIGFVIWVAVSKEGKVRLGPDHSRPQYKLFTWVAMLFAAGVGIDMLFYSVTGPIQHYMTPPNATPESAAAAEEAVVWTMFHYGVGGWSVYSLLGMAMGYFAYRWGMPLSIRAAIYPLFGKRVKGAVGDTIDIFALIGTVFGVATSMGIGVVLLNIGFAWLFGLEEGLALQIALIIVAVVLTIAACTSGVDKGIRWISELNLWSAGAMIVYILVTGQTGYLLNALVANIGKFIATFPGRTLETMVYQDGGSAWMSGQTLFFWAFWLAWGPFVGLFLARISRGRTLREFVIAAITAPVLCDFLIVSIFGNSALFEVRENGNMEFAQLAMESPEHGWYALLEMFPGAAFLIGLGTLSGLLFYLTSANSGAMVMSNFSSSIADPSQDGPKWLRIFWAILTAVLTIAMLVAGGVTTMEYATLIFGLPVTIVAYLVMASFSKVLRMERAEREGRALRRRTVSASGGSVPEKTWRQRLANMRSYPSKNAVAQFVTRVAHPALEEVSREFAKQGYASELTATPGGETGVTGYTLVIDMAAQQNFHYEVEAVEAPVPMFGGRMSRETDVYYRLEVFTRTGSEGYDLMGLSKQQVINDVIDRFESHLSFLQHSNDVDAASVLTPPVTTGQHAAVAASTADADAPTIEREPGQAAD
ncbi:choline BCCT transporter BetT [Gulosibacter molinativorax]|uniref:High-affinity choline transporter BetT n=1 Tax=Gulosibacter molinativorax TaxID=256821 RepID=A0ABT7CAF1_9MICO|nr:choline BCCT transporter BetT [Gulosibacter molinativorax]MDJ1372105.1 high-affinity choline transporter BetT [Gulosibacter molinativorax]QUY62350.1 High-affinity choline transport protein [Gulosibacter molinativorax]